MKKLDDLIENIEDLSTFTQSDPLNSQISERMKGELLEELSEIRFELVSKSTNDASSFTIADREADIVTLKNRVRYLEGFIVRLARKNQVV